MSVRIQNALLAGIIGLMIGSVPTAAVAGGGGMMTDISRDTIGVVRSGVWFLRSSTDPACGTATFKIFGYGAAGDTTLVMDLTGDGLDQATVFRDSAGFGQFFVRANNDSGAQTATTINFGAAGDLPITGNFDTADDSEEVAVYRPSSNRFFVQTDSGVETFVLGVAGDIPVAGNFDGAGGDEVGVFRPSTNQFFFKSENTSSGTITTRALGAAGDAGIVGDWDADDTATPGATRDRGGLGLIHFLNNMTSGTTIDTSLPLGLSTDETVVGDFDGPTVDEDGCSMAN